MPKEVVKVLVVLTGVTVGMVVFLAALAFLVSDSCLDSGGAIGGSPFVCVPANGKEWSWFVMLRPVIVTSLGMFVGFSTFLLIRWVLRRTEKS